MNAPDHLKIGFEPPSFQPHITLASFPATLANVETIKLVVQRALSSWNEIISKNALICAERGLSISFSALSASDDFFRSVLLDIDLTPELRALQSTLQIAAEQVLGQAAGEIVARSPRFPHLSLFYVPDEHENERTRIRDALWDAYGVDEDTENDARHIAFKLSSGARMDGIGSAESHAGILEGFDASEIWIASCEGPVKDWIVLERISTADASDLLFIQSACKHQ